jgi:hypothetical protein
MAVSLVTQTPKQLYGLSTDAKPTAGIPVGSTFYMLDTSAIYIADGLGNWYLQS